ncbi:MAG: hypothetical protein BJ554DRAFT_4204, partial [Olpidium bornovanus]
GGGVSRCVRRRPSHVPGDSCPLLFPLSADRGSRTAAQEQAAPDLGQESSQRTHQAHHRQRHPVLRPGNHRHQRLHKLHHLPGAAEQDPGHKAALPCHDHQKPEKIFHFRGAGPRRQERQEEIPSVELPGEGLGLGEKGKRRGVRGALRNSERCNERNGDGTADDDDEQRRRKKRKARTPLAILVSTTRVKPFICTMPMRLDDGWNQIQFNLVRSERRAIDFFSHSLFVLPASDQVLLRIGAGGRKRTRGLNGVLPTSPPHPGFLRSACARGGCDERPTDCQSDFTRRAYGTNYIETLRVQIHANCRIRRIYFSDRLYSEEELPPEFKLFLPIQKQT